MCLCEEPAWQKKRKKKESDVAILQEAIVLDQSKGKQSVLQCKFFCPLCSYVKYSITELKPTTLPGGVKGLLALYLSLYLSLSLQSNLHSLQVSQMEGGCFVFFSLPRFFDPPIPEDWTQRGFRALTIC